MLNMDDRTLRRAIDRGELAAEPGPTKNSPRRISRGDVQRYAAERGIPLNVNGKSIDAATGVVIEPTAPIGGVVDLQAKVVELAAERPARRASGASSSSEWVERAVRAETRLEMLRELLSAQSNPETIDMLRVLVAAWEVQP